MQALPPPRKKGVVSIRDTECADSRFPKMLAYVSYSMWYNIPEDCNLNFVMLPVRYSVAVPNTLNAYELGITPY
jgi:hypothetical protein